MGHAPAGRTTSTPVVDQGGYSTPFLSFGNVLVHTIEVRREQKQPSGVSQTFGDDNIQPPKGHSRLSTRKDFLLLSQVLF